MCVVLSFLVLFIFTGGAAKRSHCFASPYQVDAGSSLTKIHTRTVDGQNRAPPKKPWCWMICQREYKQTMASNMVSSRGAKGFCPSTVSNWDYDPHDLQAQLPSAAKSGGSQLLLPTTKPTTNGVPGVQYPFLARWHVREDGGFSTKYISL